MHGASFCPQEGQSRSLGLVSPTLLLLPAGDSGASAIRARTGLSRFVESGGQWGSGLRAVASLTATGISNSSPRR
jgi:hypothetical protein